MNFDIDFKRKRALETARMLRDQLGDIAGQLENGVVPNATLRCAKETLRHLCYEVAELDRAKSRGMNDKT